VIILTDWEISRTVGVSGTSWLALCISRVTVGTIVIAIDVTNFSISNAIRGIRAAACMIILAHWEVSRTVGVSVTSWLALGICSITVGTVVIGIYVTNFSITGAVRCVRTAASVVVVTDWIVGGAVAVSITPLFTKMTVCVTVLAVIVDWNITESVTATIGTMIIDHTLSLTYTVKAMLSNFAVIISTALWGYTLVAHA